MAKVTEFNMLMVLFDNFNTLDANGPYEVFRKSGTSQHFKKITVAVEDEHATSVEGVMMKRNVPLDDELINNIADYDILVVPGGSPSDILALANDPKRPIGRLIKAFSELKPKSEYPERILMSVCSGALFLSALGILNHGRYCTTHWGFYEQMVETNKAAAAKAGADVKPGVLIPARYVDSGPNEHGVRIVTAGGISCGMDAALHVVEMRTSMEEARATADLLDYAWNRVKGVQLGKY